MQSSSRCLNGWTHNRLDRKREQLVCPGCGATFLLSDQDHNEAERIHKARCVAIHPREPLVELPK